MIPPVHYEKARRLAQRPEGGVEEEEELEALKDEHKYQSVAVKNSEMHLPPYELRKYEEIAAHHTALRKLLFGAIPNKHEHLFCGGAMGEEFLTTCIRLEALGSAIYIAIFFIMMLNPILEELRGRTPLLVAVLVLAFIPVVVNFYALSVMVSDFVIVSSVEKMKDRKAIQEVKRGMVTKKAMTALKLLNTMRQSLPSIHASTGEPLPKKTPEEVWPNEEVREEKKEEMKEMFDLFDTDGGGTIDKDELGKLLTMLKIGKNAKEHMEIFNDIDEDGGGEIEFEEFFHWIATHTADNEEEMGEEALEKMSNQLFDMIDEPDEDDLQDLEAYREEAEITPAEFYKTVSKLSQGKEDMELSLEDIEAMFHGVDENGDGKLDREEFTNMIKKFMFSE